MEVEGVEEVQRPLKRVAHRGGENFSAAPVTTATGARGSNTCFLRQITGVPPAPAKAPTAQLCHGIPAFSSAILAVNITTAWSSY